MNDWTPNNGMYTRRIAVGAREIDQIVSYRPASTDWLTGYGHWGFSCWHGLEELRAPVYEYHTLDAAVAAADEWMEEHDHANAPETP